MLESVSPQPPINANSSPSFDDMPIGGKRFEFSEYPEEGEIKLPPKKPFKPRANKQSKKGAETVPEKSDTSEMEKK